MTFPIPAALLRCHPDARAAIIASLPEASVRALNATFGEWAHAGQIEPEGDWRTWVVMAGRGFGKTRAGAEWVMARVRCSAPWRPSVAAKSLSARRRGPAPTPTPPHERERLRVRIALVAASLDEARRVMVEGPSGILAVARAGEVADWSFARRTIAFANGAAATLFSGAHPEGLRGPEHDYAWCDELAKWRRPGEAWDNLQLGLRRGERPRALVTTTPRRGAALRAILDDPTTAVSGGPSAANPHLAAGWVAAQAARLGPGLLGRQELGGELIDDVEGALWPRELLQSSQNGTLTGEMRRIVIGVDPPAGVDGDACGIVAVGLGEDGIGYVLGDHSVGGLSPEGWARKVAAAVAAHKAAQVIAEANNGGRMVEAVLRGAGVGAPVRLVHAADAKVARAAPVAALFEAGRAKFAGRFPELEDELAGLSWSGAYQGPGRSPDRADAMVWALSEVMLGRRGEPRIAVL